MPWTQSYDPLGNPVLSTCAAALPLVLLLGLLATHRVRAHIAAVVALVVVFGITTPYFFVHPHEALDQLRQQAQAAGESEKLGQEQQGGFYYYLSSFTWGFGWAAIAAAAVGAAFELSRDRVRGILLLAFPVVAYGYTEHTMDFPGGYTIRPQVLLEFYYDIGESIVRNGFRRLVFLNGHGSNVNVMNLAARLLTVRTPALAAATSWWDLCRAAVAERRESAFPGGMAHACELETSAYLSVEPDRVELDAAEDVVSTLNNEWTYSDLAGAGPVQLVPWWSQTSANGTEGTPSLASAEKGERLFTAARDKLVEVCRQLHALPVRGYREFGSHCP
jgi:creatinine amidohydrolase